MKSVNHLLRAFVDTNFETVRTNAPKVPLTTDYSVDIPVIFDDDDS
jgi:hypothetical protein